MIILIAESKTMAACNATTTAEQLADHRPVFDDDTAALMHSWADLSVADLASAIKISRQMARVMREMILNFPDKTHGGRAIEAYTGVVFRALAYRDMSAGERSVLSRKVRIISSLYGWLHPEDIIKPYRLDFTTPLAPGDARMFSYWRPKVTQALISELRCERTAEILDLLPGDAAKCIDWTEVRKVAEVAKVDFQTADGSGTLRTPHANLLKTLRGELLRQIITDDIRSLASLRELSGTPDGEGTITFIV